MKEVLDRLLEKYKISRQTLLFAAGLIGIALIAFAPGISFGSDASEAERPAEQTAEGYAAALEERLTSILQDVEGVGKVKVMITLKSGYSYVYAKQEKNNSDRLEDSKAADSRKTQEKNVTEETYILVDGPGGGKEPLVTAQIEPEIKGVVVVCQGGGNPVVAARVTETVTVALNISSTQITVSQLSAEYP